MSAKDRVPPYKGLDEDVADLLGAYRRLAEEVGLLRELSKESYRKGYKEGYSDALKEAGS